MGYTAGIIFRRLCIFTSITLIQNLAVFTVIAGIIQATLIVLAGVYGSPAELGITGIAILVAQLTLATVALTYLDEVLEKGHGLGSGSMLFIGAHACTTAHTS